MRSISRRRLVRAGAVVAALAMAAGAYAFWTASGTGAGTAGTADPGAQGVTVVQTSASSGLYPGGSVALSGTLTNSNENSVRVHSIAGAVAGVDAAHAAAGCDPSDYTVGPAVTIDQDVPGNSTTTPWSGLTLSMADTDVDQGACKGAVVDIDYTAN